MIEKRPHKKRNEHLKTESISETQITLMEFGKPVKLPNIHKKMGRYQNDIINSRSIEARNSVAHNKSLVGKSEQKNIPQQINIRKYSNNSQFNLLTLQEMQLCSQRSKKFLPKIAGMANCFVSTRENNEYFDKQQFMRRLSRMKSQKKIQSTCYDQLYNYKLDSIIGRGSYSIVRLGYSLTGKQYAIKIYGKNKLNSVDRMKNLERQIEIMKKIEHENIIEFKEQIETEDNIYLIMELFNNCSLGDFVKKKNCEKEHNLSIILEQQSMNHEKKLTGLGTHKNRKKLNQHIARKIFFQIIQAISYLHSNNIVHRDIKLDNVLIESKQMKIKLIDFGFSCYDHSNAWHEDYCGTPNYISPEILRKQGYRGKPADIWALGILLFYLVAGYYPFKCPSQHNDYENIQYRGEFSISKQLTNLLYNMLKNKPEDRFTIQQILQSDWLKTV